VITEDVQKQLASALWNTYGKRKLPIDIIDLVSGEILIPANRRITKSLCRRIAKSRMLWFDYPRL
jgi:DNA-directed RNA polymerase subunit beta